MQNENAVLIALKKAAMSKDSAQIEATLNAFEPIDVTVITQLISPKMLDKDYREFFLSTYKNLKGSFNICDQNSTLLIAAINTNLPLAFEIIKDEQTDVNFCGPSFKTPLNILKNRMLTVTKRINEILDGLILIKESLDTNTLTLEKYREIIARHNLEHNDLTTELDKQNKTLELLEKLSTEMENKGALSFISDNNNTQLIAPIGWYSLHTSRANSGTNKQITEDKTAQHEVEETDSNTEKTSLHS